MLTDYSIIHELSAAQLDELMQLYAPEFWTLHRRREDVARMIANTDLIFAAVDRGGTLVGFCRVMTDFVYRATLFDVIVSPHVRGGGVGKLLIDAVVNHPKLRGVEAIDLSCKPEMAPFYEKWGFDTDLSGTIFMRRRRA